MEVFEKLLGLGSLECLEAPLVHQQVAFPISSGGIGLISLEVIAQTAYLKSWALVALVTISRFLLNSHMFLLEVKGVNNSSPLPFYTHLKLTHGLLPLRASTCVPPLE
jgi:hypothetical protein